jgi:ABC-type sulfate transport system substrate-binding protein
MPFTIDDVFGDGQKAHFSDDGIFDRIYTSGK